MILLLGDRPNELLRWVEWAAMQSGVPVVWLTSADIANDLLVADDIDDDGRVEITWTIAGRRLPDGPIDGVLNRLDELDFSAFGDLAEEDREFAWQEARAYLLFALTHLPNVINRPSGDHLAGWTGTLPAQWGAASGDRGTRPRWLVSSSGQSAVPWAPARTIRTGDPARVQTWRPSLPSDAPLAGWTLLAELPFGQLVDVVVAGEDTWLWPADDPLPDRGAEAIRAAARERARSFDLAFAQVQVFYSHEPELVTVGSVRPFNYLELIPIADRWDVVSRIVTALTTEPARASPGQANRARLDSRPDAIARQRRVAIPVSARLDLPEAYVSLPHRAAADRSTSTRLPEARLTIIAGETDPTARYLEEAACSRGVEVAFWPAQDVPAIVDALRSLPPERSPGVGIFYRRPGARDDQLYRWLDVLDDILAAHPGPVVGNTYGTGTNHSKPLQIAAIGRHATAAVRGIRSSIRSLDGSDADRIRKAMSSGKAEVLPFTTAQGADQVLAVPAFLQPRLSGTNVRVHTCPGVVSALQIRSDRLDYRFDPDFEVARIELPPEVARWCEAMTAVEGLAFAGIDLIRAEDGTHACLEVNPNPGYQVFEQRLLERGDPATISEALLSVLVPA